MFTIASSILEIHFCANKMSLTKIKITNLCAFFFLANLNITEFIFEDYIINLKISNKHSKLQSKSKSLKIDH